MILETKNTTLGGPRDGRYNPGAPPRRKKVLKGAASYPFFGDMLSRRSVLSGAALSSIPGPPLSAATLDDAIIGLE